MSKFSACALSAKLIQPLYFQCIENNDKDGKLKAMVSEQIK